MEKPRPPLDPLHSLRRSETIAWLRGILSDVGYTAPRILRALGLDDFRSLRLFPPEVLAARLESDEPFHLFIRLFLLEASVEAGSFKQGVSPLVSDRFFSTGLVQRNKDLVNASLKLRPHGDLILAHDLTSRLSGSDRKDFVMGLGESSLTLLNATIRRKSRLTLDLGTGCGVQAMAAAGHSERVLAVDVNPRAVRFAGFNAVLNGLANVEALEGNFFDPVEPYLFDLVVSNPPFVISPERKYIYRDGGMEADRTCETLVRAVPRFLREGGYCQVLCSWVERSGEDWRNRLASWFAGSDCDALVLRLERQEAEDYAALWIGHTEKAEPELFGARFKEWLGYYREQGIRSIGSGLITMRRSSGRANWFRANDTPGTIPGPRCGDLILRRFQAIDFLDATDDRCLFALPFRVPKEIRMRRELEHSGGGWKSTGQVLCVEGGMGTSERISPFVAEFIAGCDGRNTLREAFAGAARDFGIDPADIPAPFRTEVRRLIECGYILPPRIDG